MRELIKQFVKVCSETLPISEPVFEFGAFQVPHQIGFADLRPFFPGKKYIGADMRMGTGVDIILDLHEINRSDNSVGTVLCFDTLEHVEYPHKALQEIHRIMRQNCIVIISSVMNFPIHDYPSDYWRFTPEAFRSILSPFTDCFVGYAGDERFPHTVIGIGCKGSSLVLDDFLPKYKEWQECWFNPEGKKEEDIPEETETPAEMKPMVPGEVDQPQTQQPIEMPQDAEQPLVKLIKLFIPPVFLSVYRKIYWTVHDRLRGNNNGKSSY